jgi:hypothetical protein
MRKPAFRLGAAVFCLAAGAVSVRADEMKKSAEPAADQKAIMEAWQKFATPGAAHKKFEYSVGTWNVAAKSWMAPGAKPEESTGKARFELLMGGRFLQQTFDGTMMGQPFHGMGLNGYDNEKKVYQSVWIDDMGTAMLSMTGHWDEAGNAFEETGSMDNFMTGEPVAIKGVMKKVDADHFTYDMWMAGPDGKMFQNLGLTYTRAK